MLIMLKNGNTCFNSNLDGGQGLPPPPPPPPPPNWFSHSVTFYQTHSCQIWYFLLPQSPDIKQNSDGVISDFRISGQSLVKRNCHNSRASDIDMKLGPVTKLDKRNKITSKKLTMTSCRKIVTSLPFFQFTANLEQSRSWITEAWSIKLKFSLLVTFYLAKTENRTRKSLTQLSHYCFE